VRFIHFYKFLSIVVLVSCSSHSLESTVLNSSSQSINSISYENSFDSSSSEIISSTQATNSSSIQPNPSEIEFVTFRLRGDNIVNYSNHALWIWEDGAEGELYVFQNVDSYGGYIELPITTWTTKTKLNYIIRPANTWSGQSADTTIFFADFIDYVTQGIMNIYLILHIANLFFLI